MAFTRSQSVDGSQASDRDAATHDTLLENKIPIAAAGHHNLNTA